MAPNGRGAHKTGPLRPHSRSSSATKITPNLQFTQKDQFSKHPQKKAGYDVHLRPAPTSRVSSKDQIAPLQKRHAPPSAITKPKSKAAFMVAVSPGDDDGDDDEWVSSESGVTTPNPVDSDDSEGEMGAAMATPVEERRSPMERIVMAKAESEMGVQQGGETPTARISTMRPSGFEPHTGDAVPRDNPKGLVAAPRVTAALPPTTLPPEPSKPKFKSVSHKQPEGQRHQAPAMAPAQHQSSSLDTRASMPRPSNSHKRQASTRPPSTYSISSKAEHAPLRPHPLIRGQSFGQPVATSRPTPLAPLTTSDAASTRSSSSPPSHDSVLYTKASASPSTISVSPTSPYPHSATATTHPRRTSVSSVRSIATLPVSSTTRETKSSRDRNRTLSTISQSSSSAALSSLAHLPAVTRPPSPQMITFFPPVKPQANPEAIHELLPPPYLSNHLTVLAYRTPLRESYDRVMRAKMGR